MAVHLTRATDSWTPVDLTQLPEKPPIRPNLGSTGLIYPGKRHVFSGPPESAKTLAAYCILILVARNQGTGALLDFEMGAYDARQRLRELGASEDEISRILYLEPDEPATPERIQALIEHQPELVVIDAAAGAYETQGLDDNKRSEVERFANLYIKLFWRHEIATILIDHVVKNAEQRGRFQIGSERKLGASDVHYGFDIIKPVSRGSSGHYKIHTHKDRAGYMRRGHLADLHLDSDPDTHQINWRVTDPEPTTEEGYFRPTHLMEKVSTILEHRNDPATRNEVYAAVGGTKDYVLKAIAALLTENYITETAGPNRSKLLTSTRAYREDDPDANPSGSVVRQWFGSSSEPLNPCSSAGSQQPDNPSGSADSENGSTMRWFGSSERFDSGSRTTHESGGSVVRVRSTYEPPEPLSTDHHEQLGWFGADGHLNETDLAYLDSLAPDLEDDT